ncbi:hypothetical protein PIB30_094917 [Stylosanthes scabra]|nr:hypothetical protein [Stylosanthes scabra]
MKTCLNRLKDKEIALITIVVMSAIIILWNWEKTSYLTVLFPPQDPFQLSSGQIDNRSIPLLFEDMSNDVCHASRIDSNKKE